MRFLVICNPIAGRGQSELLVRRFVRTLEQRGHLVDLFITAAAGEAMERARILGTDVDRLVVAGGDGTVNEVLNGLASPSGVPLLHFPTGTANQLARTLGLPFDPQDLTRVAEHGRIRHIDMGLAGHRRFLLVASAGFDAKVTEEVKKTRTDTLGYAGYVFPVLKALASHEAQELYVRIDDGEVVAGYQAMVLKVSRYGGLFSFAQEARLDSGLFSVCVIQEAAIMSWGLFAVAGLLGTASHCPGVVHRTARRVFIESSDPVPVEIDGDYFGMTPIGIDLQPSIVPVIVPENA